MKSPQCCGRLQGRLVHEEGNLARLARAASKRQAKGLEVSADAKLEIVNAKQAVTTCKQIISDHEAEHAGTPEGEVA